jgi:hypothetical protein
MKQQPLQNKYLQPIDSPIDNSNTQKKYVPWEFGVIQGMQLKKIRSSTGYFKKLSAGTQGTTSITNGTITSSLFNSGTITNSSFQGTISQPVESGGTFTNPTINTGTLNTSLFSGTINNSVLGTPSITGGTVNSTYQTGGTTATSGSIIYVKTVSPGTTFGTLSFNNGLIISFS